MLYRKIKLSTFGLYLKAVSKLWLVPLLTVNAGAGDLRRAV